MRAATKSRPSGQDFAQDILLKPKPSKLSSRVEVDLFREFKFPHSTKTYRGIPIVASNMDTVGTFEMATVLAKHNCFTTIHKHNELEQWEEFAKNCEDSTIFDHVAISAGSKDLEYLCEKLPQIQYICLDVANGYSQHFVDFVRQVRSRFPEHTIFAGNVVTGEMVEELILAGADVVKVGIGPGSVCTTRRKAGVGCPQLSAVIECAKAAHALNGHVMSDSEFTNPGDVAKAFAAEADFFMLGGLFAGHDQSGGKVIEKKRTKIQTLLRNVFGYRNEKTSRISGRISGQRGGDVKATILDMLRGLRSGCTYTGSERLAELPKQATFYRTSAQTNDMYNQLEI